MKRLWGDHDHEDTCPACGDRIEGLANMEGIARPGPGDACICISCLSINVMGDDSRIRHATSDEALMFAADPGIQEVIMAMRFLGPPPRRR